MSDPFTLMETILFMLFMVLGFAFIVLVTKMEQMAARMREMDDDLRRIGAELDLPVSEPGRHTRPAPPPVMRFPEEEMPAA